MGGLYKCDTCRWISRDGRCFNNNSPHGLDREQMSANDSCSSYEMDFALKRNMEQQKKEREESERKERERQKWLASEDGQRWQADERKRKEHEEHERRERERREREELERKEREYQKWLASEEGQKWQAEERERKRIEAEREKKRKTLANCGLFLQLGLMIAFFYVIFGTDVIFHLMESMTLSLLVFGAISWAFGVISLLFRRKAGSVWGVLIFLLLDVVFCITMSVLEGSGFSTVITACILIAIPASPGFFILHKTEHQDKSTRNTIIAASIIGVIIIGGLIVWSLINNQPGSAAEASAIPNAAVTSDTINLHFGPRMNSRAIKTLKRDDAVSVVAGKTRKGWLLIEHDGDKGYVRYDHAVFTYLFPRLGNWQVTGRDTVNWTANMVIDEINNNNFGGYFEWRGGSNYRGREYFRGVYDPQTEKVSIQGYRLANDRGLGLGNYEASLTGNDFRLGTWDGGGKWEAIWRK